MRFTYLAAANDSTNGTALGAAGEDVVIKKLIIGQPVASANILIYNKAVAFGGDTADIAVKYTLPGTLTASYEFPYDREIDFGEEGLQVDGGNVTIDQNLQLTVVWEKAGE